MTNNLLEYFTRHINPETKDVTYKAKLHYPIWLRPQQVMDFVNEMIDLRCNGRICLHSGDDAPLHDMIIFENSSHHFGPHKHPTKSETITPMIGSLSLTIFHGSRSSVSEYKGLEREHSIIIPPDTYHQIKTDAPFCLYREHKVGPFLGTADREFLR